MVFVYNKIVSALTNCYFTSDHPVEMRAISTAASSTLSTATAQKELCERRTENLLCQTVQINIMWPMANNKNFKLTSVKRSHILWYRSCNTSEHFQLYRIYACWFQISTMCFMSWLYISKTYNCWMITISPFRRHSNWCERSCWQKQTWHWICAH